MKTIAISIEESMLERIDRIAYRKGRSANRSRLIRDAIREHLLHLEKTREEEHEREVFKLHKDKLRRQAVALIKEQSKP
jgi:metal-responsive CopG/Arc/MetJ family transcriptional regulator